MNADRTSGLRKYRDEARVVVDFQSCNGYTCELRARTESTGRFKKMPNVDRWLFSIGMRFPILATAHFRNSSALPRSSGHPRVSVHLFIGSTFRRGNLAERNAFRHHRFTSSLIDLKPGARTSAQRLPASMTRQIHYSIKGQLGNVCSKKKLYVVAIRLESGYM